MTTDTNTIVRLGTAVHVVNPAVDALERALLTLPAADCPLRHFHTPGLYCREIFMPAGSIVTSKIHMTEHQFIVSKGRCSVWIEGEGWREFKSPAHGITMPGTRRLLVVHEDTIWTTMHPTSKQTVEEIEADIICPHRDHLVGLEQPMAEAIRLLNPGEL